MEKTLPSIPAKRYFTIGEVSELCGVKPYVLRYWEQEFGQLKPMKRRGNRRYYQHHEVLLIRRIRELLYDQGFTISGARNRLSEAASVPVGAHGDHDLVDFADPRAVDGHHRVDGVDGVDGADGADGVDGLGGGAHAALAVRAESILLVDGEATPPVLSAGQMRQELLSIRALLSV